MYQNPICIWISWYGKNCWFLVKKMLMPAELMGCVTDLLCVRYNCAKFHHCKICVTDFREGGTFPPPLPIREQSRKSPFLIGLRHSQCHKLMNYQISRSHGHRSHIFRQREKGTHESDLLIKPLQCQCFW